MKPAQSPQSPAWRPSFWRREHHLDRMSFRELVIAYFQYPAIIAYLALAAAALGLYAWRPAPLLPTAAQRRRGEPRLPLLLVSAPPPRPAQPLDVEA